MGPNCSPGSSNQPHLSPIDVSQLPHLSELSQFSNSQESNEFPRINRVVIVLPTTENIPDGNDVQNGTLPQEQRWESQNNQILNHDDFPPTSSPPSIESNDEESSPSNQQRDQDTEHQECHSLDTNPVVLEQQSSEDMNASPLPFEVVLCPTSNENMFDIEVSIFALIM